ncbi:MAG: SDR family NAD(P)-dependent oxidoreductase [Alphaproteobacteria bacterium]|nr:SDR family NAD(P)-dependent oxidoreductase [Alphaproteobacteria bacterium]
MADGSILVTGADGFIGSHLVEALVAQGRKVRAFVLYNALDQRGWIDHLAPGVAERIEVVAGDIRDAAALAEAMRGCDRVLHLAALIGIPYSYVAPASYIDVNVKGTLHVVEAARQLGVAKVVVTSTSEVYGTARRVPIDEDHPLVGQSPYAASKIGGDQIALSYWRSFGVPVCVVRPFNTYGPRQSQRAIIPTIVTQIAAGADRIKLGALTPTRDLSHVGDTVDGMIAALDCAAATGETINLGSGHEIAIGDLARLIAGLMGRKVAVETDQARLRPKGSEVERLLADHSKARRLMNWSPRYGGPDGLARGLEATIAWFRDPANLARYRVGQYTV